MLRPVLHLILHFCVPAIVARWGYRARFKQAFFIMMATMAVDLDHLLADPLYAPDRCSIGFHPLHTFWPILIYGLLMIFPKTRLVGIGLIIHMVLDGIDCWLMG
ncbi:MAG: hypothetical protein ACI9FJ_000194 [Alteromonadaceae bacterium]|jgi:hypothetical protein